jgi:hypothetical protein
LLDALSPAERRRLLPVLNGPGTRIGLADAPRDMPQSDTGTAGADLVRRQLRERLGEDVALRVALAGFVMHGPMRGHVMGPMARHRGPMGEAHAMASRFIVQAQLRDGSRVWFERHSGGTGLGLGIARNIARAHGGDFVLRNRAGGGLVAALTLPR